MMTKALVALLALVLAAPAHAQHAISALYAVQAFQGAVPWYAPTFVLHVTDAAPESVVVIDPAFGEVGSNHGLRVMVRGDKPEAGVLYGPYAVPPLYGDPPFWRVLGWLTGQNLVGGRLLDVIIDGAEPITLTCRASTSPWGVTSVFCGR